MMVLPWIKFFKLCFNKWHWIIFLWHYFLFNWTRCTRCEPNKRGSNDKRIAKATQVWKDVFSSHWCRELVKTRIIDRNQSYSWGNDGHYQEQRGYYGSWRMRRNTDGSRVNSRVKLIQGRRVENGYEASRTKAEGLHMWLELPAYAGLWACSEAWHGTLSDIQIRECSPMVSHHTCISCFISEIIC